MSLKLDAWMDEVKDICDLNHWCFRDEDWLCYFENGLLPEEAVDAFFSHGTVFYRGQPPWLGTMDQQCFAA